MQNLGSRDQGQQTPAPTMVSPGLYSALWDFLQWEGMCSTVLCLSLEKHQAGDFTNPCLGVAVQTLWLMEFFLLPLFSFASGLHSTSSFRCGTVHGSEKLPQGVVLWRVSMISCRPLSGWRGPLLRGWTRTFGTLSPQGQPVWKAHPLCWGLQGFSCCSWGWEGGCWDRKRVLKELFPRAEVRVPSIRNWAALAGVFPGEETAEAKEVSPGLTRGGRAEAITSSRWLSQDRTDKLGRKSVYRTLCHALNWLTWE